MKPNEPTAVEKHLLMVNRLLDGPVTSEQEKILCAKRRELKMEMLPDKGESIRKTAKKLSSQFKR